MDETLAMLALNKPGGGGAAIFSAHNPGRTLITSTDINNPNAIASISGIAIAAGQSMTVMASAQFEGNNSVTAPILTIQLDNGGGPQTLDAVIDLPLTPPESTTFEPTTRTVTFTPAPGTYTVTMGGAIASGVNVIVPGAGAPPLGPGGQLTVIVGTTG